MIYSVTFDFSWTTNFVKISLNDLIHTTGITIGRKGHKKFNGSDDPVTLAAAEKLMNDPSEKCLSKNLLSIPGIGIFEI